MTALMCSLQSSALTALGTHIKYLMETREALGRPSESGRINQNQDWKDLEGGFFLEMDSNISFIFCNKAARRQYLVKIDV